MRASKAALGVVAIAVLSQAALAYKPIRQPTTADLATVWISSTPDALEFLRLELTESGTGLLTVQYLPHYPARAYRVKQVILERYRVKFDVQPDEAEAEPIFLRGEAIPGRLTLDIGGSSGKWKSKVVLVPLATLLERIDTLTKRANEVREPQP